MRVTPSEQGAVGSASCLVGDCLDEEVPQGVAGLSTRCLDLGLPPPFQPLPRQAFLEGRGGGRGCLGFSWRQQLIVLSRPLPGNAKSTGLADSAPKPVQPVVREEGAPGRGSRRCQSCLPQPSTDS